MSDALRYLLWHSARNRLRGQVARLKRPRYLLAVVAGGLYFGTLLFNSRMPSPLTGSTSSAIGQLIYTALIFVTVASGWIFGSDRPALVFTEAEVQLLFPAPLSRSALVRYKVAQAQIVVLFSVVIWVVLLRRGGTSLPFWMRAISLWIILSTLYLHRVGASLVRTSAVAHGRRGMRTNAIPIVIVTTVILVVVITIVRAIPTVRAALHAGGGAVALEQLVTSQPLAAILFPFRLLIAPLFADTSAHWLIAILPAFALMAVHYPWVTHTDAAFEEAVADAAAKRARAIAVSRGTRRRPVIAEGAVPRSWFRLAPTGHPAIAIIWKNVLAYTRALRLTTIVIVLCCIAVIAAAVYSEVGDWSDLAQIGETLCAIPIVMLVVLGPGFVRADLRQDLLQLDQLRSYPLRALDDRGGGDREQHDHSHGDAVSAARRRRLSLHLRCAPAGAGRSGGADRARRASHAQRDRADRGERLGATLPWLGAAGRWARPGHRGDGAERARDLRVARHHLSRAHSAAHRHHDRCLGGERRLITRDQRLVLRSRGASRRTGGDRRAVDRDQVARPGVRAHGPRADRAAGVMRCARLQWPAARGSIKQTVMPSLLMRSKRLLVGRPLASERLEEEKLSKTTALAVLSSDAISSVAYATEQILFVLAVLPGVVASTYVFPISVVIVALLVLVGLSYRQTIFAYPGGGGSFTVAKDNLGVGPGLVAAAALLTDYVLTVSVSISSGVAAIVSAYPALTTYRVSMCICAILLLMLVNLRGVRESGAAFSLPTYIFIAMMLALIGVGLYRLSMGHEPAPVSGATHVDPVSLGHAAMGTPVAFGFLYLMMRGFAEGCSAMTGTEAISNGITAFRAPAPRNAAKTLGWMVTILAVFFLGVSWLAQEYAVMPTLRETVLSQLGRHIFGMGKVYYIFQYATFAILVLAANTAFADFPRLSSILASERFLPRQLAARGDRLAFSNGIVSLALVAILLVWIFQAQTTALIPLYAIGVFVCFTLSQAGMVRHWFALREPGWKWKAALNGLGAIATGIVSIVQVATKFTSGAWIVVVLIPLIILLLRAIHEHYREFAEEIKFVGHSPIVPLHHTVIVPINGDHQGYRGRARLRDDDQCREVARDVHRSRQAGHGEACGRNGKRGTSAFALESWPPRIVRCCGRWSSTWRICDVTPGELVTIVVPEIVPRHWWSTCFTTRRRCTSARRSSSSRSGGNGGAVYLGNAVRLRDRFDYDEQLDESLDQDVRMTREMLLMEIGEHRRGGLTAGPAPDRGCSCCTTSRSTCDALSAGAH